MFKTCCSNPCKTPSHQTLFTPTQSSYRTKPSPTTNYSSISNTTVRFKIHTRNSPTIEQFSITQSETDFFDYYDTPFKKIAMLEFESSAEKSGGEMKPYTPIGELVDFGKSQVAEEKGSKVKVSFRKHESSPKKKPVVRALKL